MNKLLLIIALLTVIPVSSCKDSEIVSGSCKYQDATKDLPWLKEKIASFIKMAELLGCPGNNTLIVKSALSNGKSVFVINSGICGQNPTNTEIYNCDGAILCKDTSSCQTTVNGLTEVKQIYIFGQKI
jgi:hypothetical protein